MLFVQSFKCGHLKHLRCKSFVSFESIISLFKPFSQLTKNSIFTSIFQKTKYGNGQPSLLISFKKKEKYVDCSSSTFLQVAFINWNEWKLICNYIHNEIWNSCRDSKKILFSKYGDLIKVNKVKLAEIVLNKQSLELEVNVKQDEISAIKPGTIWCEHKRECRTQLKIEGKQIYLQTNRRGNKLVPLSDSLNCRNSPTGTNNQCFDIKIALNLNWLRVTFLHMPHSLFLSFPPCIHCLFVIWRYSFVCLCFCLADFFVWKLFCRGEMDGWSK